MFSFLLVWRDNADCNALDGDNNIGLDWIGWRVTTVEQASHSLLVSSKNINVLLAHGQLRKSNREMYYYNYNMLNYSYLLITLDS
jgi:hypothetical protein